MVPADRDWTRADAAVARERYEARRQRLSRKASSGKPAPDTAGASRDERKAAVAAAFARARSRRRAAGTTA